MPLEFQESEAARFQDSWHVKVVRLSALCTSCQEILLVFISLRGHSAAGKIMSVKNSIVTIGN